MPIITTYIWPRPVCGNNLRSLSLPDNLLANTYHFAKYQENLSANICLLSKTLKDAVCSSGEDSDLVKEARAWVKFFNSQVALAENSPLDLSRLKERYSVALQCCEENQPIAVLTFPLRQTQQNPSTQARSLLRPQTSSNEAALSTSYSPNSIAKTSLHCNYISISPVPQDAVSTPLPPVDDYERTHWHEKPVDWRRPQNLTKIYQTVYSEGTTAAPSISASTINEGVLTHGPGLELEPGDGVTVSENLSNTTVHSTEAAPQPISNAVKDLQNDTDTKTESIESSSTSDEIERAKPHSQPDVNNLAQEICHDLYIKDRYMSQACRVFHQMNIEPKTIFDRAKSVNFPLSKFERNEPKEAHLKAGHTLDGLQETKPSGGIPVATKSEDKYYPATDQPDYEMNEAEDYKPSNSAVGSATEDETDHEMEEAENAGSLKYPTTSTAENQTDHEMNEVKDVEYSDSAANSAATDELCPESMTCELVDEGDSGIGESIHSDDEMQGLINDINDKTTPGDSPSDDFSMTDTLEIPDTQQVTTTSNMSPDMGVQDVPMAPGQSLTLNPTTPLQNNKSGFVRTPLLLGIGTGLLPVEPSKQSPFSGLERDASTSHPPIQSTPPRPPPSYPSYNMEARSRPCLSAPHTPAPLPEQPLTESSSNLDMASEEPLTATADLSDPMGSSASINPPFLSNFTHSTPPPLLAQTKSADGNPTNLWSVNPKKNGSAEPEPQPAQNTQPPVTYQTSSTIYPQNLPSDPGSWKPDLTIPGLPPAHREMKAATSRLKPKTNEHKSVTAPPDLLDYSRDGSFAKPGSTEIKDLISDLSGAGSQAQLRQRSVHIQKGRTPDDLDGLSTLCNCSPKLVAQVLIIVYLHGFCPLAALRQRFLELPGAESFEGLNWCREICGENLWVVDCESIDAGLVKYPTIDLDDLDAAEVDEYVELCQDGWLHVLEHAVFTTMKNSSSSKYKARDTGVTKQGHQAPISEDGSTVFLEGIFKAAGWKHPDERSLESTRVQAMLSLKPSAKRQERIAEIETKTPRLLRQVYDRYMSPPGRPAYSAIPFTGTTGSGDQDVDMSPVPAPADNVAPKARKRRSPEEDDENPSPSPSSSVDGNRGDKPGEKEADTSEGDEMALVAAKRRRTRKNLNLRRL